MELCLRAMTKIIFSDYKPSVIAGAALLLGVNIYYKNHNIINQNSFKYWTTEIEELTGYSSKIFEEPFLLMATILTNIQIDPNVQI